MRSASSSTRVFRPDRSRLPRSRWSWMRPGVPTTRWVPRASDSAWGRAAAPPHRVRILMLAIWRASRRSSCATWSASSRVGHTSSACGVKRAGSSFCSTPRPKAAVLPLPVLACAMRSRPSRISGRLCAWMGVICSKPRLFRLSSRAGRRGREVKEVSVTIGEIVAFCPAVAWRQKKGAVAQTAYAQECNACGRWGLQQRSGYGGPDLSLPTCPGTGRPAGSGGGQASGP